MKSCADCIYLHSDPFVRPCDMCQQHDDLPHWSNVRRNPATKSVVRTQARMISKLLAACHKQRDRAIKSEKEIKRLHIMLELLGGNE